MRILTVGNSPFNNTSSSKINASLLVYLKNQGHDVASSVWHHAKDYYMPDDGRFWFEKDGEKVCPIVPLDSYDSQVVALYEAMKQFNPEVVISIGDYHEIQFISAIKRMYPHFFKWVGVLTLGSFPVSHKYKDALDYLDWAFTTSKQGYQEFSRFCDVDVEYNPFFPESLFPDSLPTTRHGNFRIAACSKNSQQSNVGAFIQSVGELGTLYPRVSCYLHTNVDDDGEYDLGILRERFDLRGVISVPEEFVSFYDGIDDERVLNRLGLADVFVDCSMTAATGLSAYQAMRAGCIPLLTDTGAFRDLLEGVDRRNLYLLDSLDFLAEKEGILHIVSQRDLYSKIERLYKLRQSNTLEFLRLKEKFQLIAQRLTNASFERRIEGVSLEMQKQRSYKLAVEVLGRKRNSHNFSKH